ncbi:carbon-nitrogen hydrolase family protein [Kocuria sp.]|uniref:carbon-nitrogen hydrolase family protein n=1 Tax=Kocuria sp. TaxID=1871328 RepID=UPI0028A0D2F2|nr:carbon-nitrogen hydrolase family protein [Kocuria sp.]
MRIAIGQILSSHDPQENLAQVQELAARAGQDNADILVLPEATMFAFGRSLKNIAEPADGPWARSVSTVAQEHGVAIMAGMFSPGDEGRVRNTALIALADGRVLSYDKTHLYDAFGFKESDTVQAGVAPVTFDLHGVTVGVATCYDIRFPALFTRMAADGARVVLLGASWGDGPGKVEQWELLARARALDATSYVVAVGQANPVSVGREVEGNAPLGVGHSLVAAPDGSVVVSLADAPDYRVVDLDLGLVEKTRTAIPVLQNARDFS